jgi:hypothetical protein
MAANWGRYCARAQRCWALGAMPLRLLDRKGGAWTHQDGGGVQILGYPMRDGEVIHRATI